MSCWPECVLHDTARIKQVAGLLSVTQDDEPAFVLSVRDAYDQRIAELIGVDCLSGLCDRKALDTLTPDDTALLEQLAPIVAAWVGYHYMTHSAMQQTANGPQNRGAYERGTEGLYNQRWEEKRMSYQRRAEVYERRFRTWIEGAIAATPNIYPCYPRPNACEQQGTTGAPVFSWEQDGIGGCK